MQELICWKIVVEYTAETQAMAVSHLPLLPGRGCSLALHDGSKQAAVHDLSVSLVPLPSSSLARTSDHPYPCAPTAQAVAQPETSAPCLKQVVSLLPVPPCVPLLLLFTGSLWTACTCCLQLICTLPVAAQTLLGAVPKPMLAVQRILRWRSSRMGLHFALTGFGPGSGAKHSSTRAGDASERVQAWSSAAGIGPSDGEGGGSVWLKRAFSMLDKEDLEVDLSKLDSIAKVGLGWMTGLRACTLPLTCSMQLRLARVDNHLGA